MTNLNQCISYTYSLYVTVHGDGENKDIFIIFIYFFTLPSLVLSASLAHFIPALGVICSPGLVDVVYIAGVEDLMPQSLNCGP